MTTIEDLWSLLQRWMAIRVWRDFTVMHVVIAVAILFVVWFLFQQFVVKKRLKSVENNFSARCSSCNWKGVVKFKLTECPQCGKRTLRHQSL